MRIPNTWTGVRFEVAELSQALHEEGFGVCEVLSPKTQYMWVTARKGTTAERARGGARLRSKEWNTDALAGLISRLEADPVSQVARVLAGQTTVKDLATGFFRVRANLDPARYVSLAYETILGRPADPAGLDFYSQEIREGIKRTNVIECLICSPEFDERYRTFVEAGAS